MDNWTTVLWASGQIYKGLNYIAAHCEEQAAKKSSCIDDIQSVVSRNNFNIHLPPALNIAGLKYTGLHL
jgi:hypothetical protein